MIYFSHNFPSFTPDDKSVQTSPEQDSCTEKLSQDFSELLGENPCFSDIQFQFKDGTIILAHRNVLCTRSPVFNSMLQSDMAESRTGMVKILDTEAEDWQHFLRYVYTGTLPELTVEKAMYLYETGDKYAVDALARRCGHLLLQNLSHANAYGVLALFDVHNDANFLEEVFAYILREKVLMNDDQWSEFTDSHPKLANKVIRRLFHFLQRN